MRKMMIAQSTSRARSARRNARGKPQKCLYDATGHARASLLNFIRAVSEAACTDPSILERIMVTIGDDIGDDVLQMYLSTADQDRVTRYLLAEGLTT